MGPVPGSGSLFSGIDGASAVGHSSGDWTGRQDHGKDAGEEGGGQLWSTLYGRLIDGCDL